MFQCNNAQIRDVIFPRMLILPVLPLLSTVNLRSNFIEHCQSKMCGNQQHDYLKNNAPHSIYYKL